jgi:hypothetical protein
MEKASADRFQQRVCGAVVSGSGEDLPASFWRVLYLPTSGCGVVRQKSPRTGFVRGLYDAGEPAVSRRIIVQVIGR